MIHNVKRLSTVLGFIVCPAREAETKLVIIAEEIN